VILDKVALRCKPAV